MAPMPEISIVSAAPRVQKWYFAANLNALINAFDQIEVAVKSAIINTSLRPYALIDNREDLTPAADRLRWLERAGVTIIPHRAELFDMVRYHYGPQSDVFSGHWLRCDIPMIETEAEFVLYTDIDVMFRQEFDFSKIRPPFLACAPEHHQDDFSYFNSGVMVMNLAALRATRSELQQTLQAQLGIIKAHNDQRIFNLVYADRWTRLPNRYNWKPYWGFDPTAAVTHFHGPKPSFVPRLLSGQGGEFSDAFHKIFRRNPDGYARYLAEFNRVLTTGISIQEFAPGR